MNGIMTSTALALALLLSTCSRKQAAGDEPDSAPGASPMIETSSDAGRAFGADLPVRSAQKVDLAPPALSSTAERGVKGARNILLSFARAIELKEFGQAWTLLSPADQLKWSRTEFADIFADLAEITVAIPSGEMVRSAGSPRYVAPIAVTGRDRDGRPVRLEGVAVLQRISLADGESSAQVRWRFSALTLNWTH